MSFILPLKKRKAGPQLPPMPRNLPCFTATAPSRRPRLILKNEDGIYDHIAVYRSKKETEPLYTVQAGVFTRDLLDDSYKNDIHYMANRNMRILELSPDGNYLKMWISAGMNIDNDAVWYPKSLYQEVINNIGYSQPTSLIGAGDEDLIL